MRRSDRLFSIMRILRGGRLHRAQDLANRVDVSVRTLYRDMDALMASGVPIKGARGGGYRITDAITLPPLTLTPEELEALNLGLAIAAEVSDAEMKTAAYSLADKIDAVLSTQVVAETDAWKFAPHPFADATRGFAMMPILRAAIRARQKLRLTSTTPDGTVSTRVVRPLLMEYWGRVWTLTTWCESGGGFVDLRLDLIDSIDALPEMFVDEPGKTLVDRKT